MDTINLHDAKTHLSRLVEEAAEGKAFIIAKAGKPMVKVTPLSQEDVKGTGRLGFMAGELATPDDFDTLGAEEILKMVEGRAE